MDFRQTFISQTDSLQVFLLSKGLIPRKVIQKCYQSSIFQVAGPTKAVFTSIFSRPQCLSYVGHYPNKDNWQYFLLYVGRYPIEVIDGISFSYVGRYPIEVIDGISFRMLVVTPLR